MSDVFDTAMATAFILTAATGARRYRFARSQRRKVLISAALGVFVTLVYALQNEVALSPRSAATLLLLLASQTGTALGVMYGEGE